MSDQGEPDIIECDLCYSLIDRRHSLEHATWHEFAASPIAHGLYLAAKTAEAAVREGRADADS